MALPPESVATQLDQHVERGEQGRRSRHRAEITIAFSTRTNICPTAEESTWPAEANTAVVGSANLCGLGWCKGLALTDATAYPTSRAVRPRDSNDAVTKVMHLIADMRYAGRDAVPAYTYLEK